MLVVLAFAVSFVCQSEEKRESLEWSQSTSKLIQVGSSDEEKDELNN